MNVFLALLDSQISVGGVDTLGPPPLQVDIRPRSTAELKLNLAIPGLFLCQPPPSGCDWTPTISEPGDDAEKNRNGDESASTSSFVEPSLSHIP